MVGAVPQVKSGKRADALCAVHRVAAAAAVNVRVNKTGEDIGAVFFVAGVGDCGDGSAELELPLSNALWRDQLSGQAGHRGPRQQANG